MTLFKEEKITTQMLTPEVVQLLQGNCYKHAELTESHSFFDYEQFVDYMHAGPYSRSLHQLFSSWLKEFGVLISLSNSESRQKLYRCLQSLEEDSTGRPDLVQLADKEDFVKFLGEVCIEPGSKLEKRISSVVLMTIKQYMRSSTVH